MKKFEAWLKNRILHETKTGKVRSTSVDLQNLRLGKLSPYSTFGHYDEPPTSSIVAGNALQAIGDRMRKELGPVNAPAGLEGLDLFKKSNLHQDVMVLQLPFMLDSDGTPNSVNVISASNRRNTFRLTRRLVPDPKNDNRIVQIQDLANRRFEGKFIPYSQREHGQQSGSKMSLTDEAHEFTTALSKIKIFNLLTEKDARIQNIYDLENPRIERQEHQYKDEFIILINVFKYEKKKTAGTDYEWPEEEE